MRDVAFECQHFLLTERRFFNLFHSAVFELPEGHLLSYFGVVERHSSLDIPNALIGVAYYTYMLLFAGKFPLLLTKVAVNMAFFTTVFLAYQLTFNVPHLCIVCWTTHVINTFLWYNYMFGSSKTATSSSVKRKKE